MHTFEMFCGGDYHKLFINHGYLAVDFFFMLSGYVMAHAYDDRWDTMTVWDFCKRRLIRLQPLIILGMTIGGLLFFFQGSELYPKFQDVTTWHLILVMVIGFFLIPIPPSLDVRGWTEMFPLNGPAWSLFFEYIANILHVFVLRKLSNLIMGVLVILAAIALYYVAITSESGDLIGGWAFTPEQIKIGFTRLLFPYLAGMLLRRVVKVRSGKKTFFLTSFVLIIVLSMPRVGGYDNVWVNGLYEALIVSIVFPLIIYFGAIGEVTKPAYQKLCTFLGDISYPLYITHFPFILIYYAWVSNNDISMQEGAPVGVALMIGTIGIAYASLKLYDLPIRKWLAKKFLYSKK